jgi:hypothetical protein
MSLVLEATDSTQSMTNVYNLLCEACGISQAEATESFTELASTAFGLGATTGEPLRKE